MSTITPELLDMRTRIAEIDRYRAQGEPVPPELEISREEMRAMLRALRGDRAQSGDGGTGNGDRTKVVQKEMNLMDLFNQNKPTGDDTPQGE